MLVIAAANGEFTPQAARASGKRILMVPAGIHAGEIEGKDAGFMLLRDLTVDGLSRTYPVVRLDAETLAAVRKAQ